MLIPSKFTRLEESTIYKMKFILISKQQEESVIDIYNRTKKEFYDVSEFIHALDILFVLSLIDLQDESGIIHYAQ